MTLRTDLGRDELEAAIELLEQRDAAAGLAQLAQAQVQARDQVGVEPS